MYVIIIFCLYVVILLVILYLTPCVWFPFFFSWLSNYTDNKSQCAIFADNLISSASSFFFSCCNYAYVVYKFLWTWESLSFFFFGVMFEILVRNMFNFQNSTVMYIFHKKKKHSEDSHRKNLRKQFGLNLLNDIND